MTKKTAEHQTYTELPVSQMGLISPDKLIQVGQVAKKYGVNKVKLTSGQKIAYLGLAPHHLDNVRQDLDMGPATAPKTPASIQNCPGPEWCRHGLLPPLPLADQLQEALSGMTMPAKIKIGISACPRSCSGSYFRDLGFLALKKGWTVIFGGNGGGRPRIGDVIGKGLTDTEAIGLAVKVLDYYRQNGKERERTARFCERIGLAAIEAAIP